MRLLVGTGAYFGLYPSFELGPLLPVSLIMGGQWAVMLLLTAVFLHNHLDLVHLLLLVVVLIGIVLISTQIEQLVAKLDHRENPMLFICISNRCFNWDTIPSP